jgi:HK97 family phage major capsid protein
MACAFCQTPIMSDGLWNNIRFRNFDFRAAVGTSDECMPCVVSTDAPVEVQGVDEILSHSAEAIDFSRAPLPLIDEHRGSSSPFAVIEGLHVVAGALRGRVRFGQTQRAQELLADARAGFLRSLSVAYEVQKFHIDTEGRRIVTRWMPYEVSCVRSAADPGAAVHHSTETAMEIDEERDRAAAIVRAGRMFGSESTVLDAIESGESLASFRQKAMLKGLIRPAALGMSRSEIRRYSLSRALLNQTRLPLENTFEREIHQQLVQMHGEMDSAHYLYVPVDVVRSHAVRDMTVASAAQGGYLVGADNAAAGFVELVRPRSVALTLGAETLEGLRTNLTIPRVAAGAPITWLSTEATPATEGQPNLGSIALMPKSVSTYTEFSRQLLLQSNPSVDRVLTNDLLRAIATAVDVAVINGSGAGGQPSGILNTPGIGTFSGTALALAGVFTAQTGIGDNLSPACGYATTRAVASLLAQRQNFTGSSVPLWTGNLYDGQLGGYRSMTSGNVPTGALLFGDWPAVLVATWGGLAIEINPYANFATGIIGARVIHSLDVAVRRLSAFTAAAAVT